MSNEQLIIIRQIALLCLFVAAIAMLLFYVYWQQTKTILSMFKGGIVAVLVMLGIMNEDNNS